MRSSKAKYLLVTVLIFIGISLSAKKDSQLEDDLNKIWPLVQTVKIEYDLVMVQLEMMEEGTKKEKFLLEYESFVKNKYFDEVIKLNIRQGKLLLLLIHREIGRTPYDLLKEFLNLQRANFWQKFASFLGADLKGKYSAEKYPEIESIVLNLSNQEIHPYIPTN
jgi:hypothetical protein